ncbi:MAG: hypothetical protein AAB955_01685 [Patescibacteria group bacterium]
MDQYKIAEKLKSSPLLTIGFLVALATLSSITTYAYMEQYPDFFDSGDNVPLVLFGGFTSAASSGLLAALIFGTDRK